MAETAIDRPQVFPVRGGTDDGYIPRGHFAYHAHSGFSGDIDDGEAMKLEFKTVDELLAFVRGTMLARMHDSVTSMKKCGSSAEDIEALVADTMGKIEEACDEAAQIYAAAQEEFNAPITIN